ncbi:hypothetical protein G5B40_20195 [Pikeienuella piscinae]|uniref:RapA2 cadherin-like domain-containing protein n=1 Tax=Pikeienuella piscinae TaxID=2748098 RepID=A0A7M3T6D3_9RHOB|nr:Ig-like domain-containing protein [Pikeienuella piscinae]QIE57564.1 hypothetical protein G5B40_20195 [Pikeienuella piscinae]
MPLTTFENAGFAYTDADGGVVLDLKAALDEPGIVIPTAETIKIVSDDTVRSVVFAPVLENGSFDGRIVVDFAQFADLGAGEAESLSILFDLQDGESRIAAMVPLTVTGLNDAPEAADQAFSVVAGTALKGVLPASDVEGDALRFTLLEEDGAGDFTLSRDGTFVFVPESDADGAFEATVRVEDDVGGATEFEVSIDVSAPAPAPAAAGAAPAAARAAPVLDGETLDGDEGNNGIEGGDRGNLIRGFAGEDSLFGRGGADSILGGADDDVIRGNSGADTLRGGGGDDLMFGQRGTDMVFGALGDDTLNGGDGADAIVGGRGADILIGAYGRDNILGEVGADRLVGGPGSDRLEGGPGADFLIGGGARDRFIFTDNFGRDRIADFNPTKEVLNFTGHSGVNSMADLTIRQMDGDTVIRDGGNGQITLSDVDISEIDADDFLF